MNEKAKIILRQRLNKIINRTFLEDDIKLLLIEIREFLKNESILRELCDSIAHPERNKGLSHKRIDSRYAKHSLAKKRMEELHTDGTFENNPEKPWSYFSDQILDFINTRKIEKSLFETVIKNGIDEIGDSSFLQYYNLDKKKVRLLVGNSYKEKGGYFHLKAGITEKDFVFLDDLLKFIRGTTTGSPAFDQTDIETDFLNAVSRLTKKYRIDVNLEIITERQEEIVVCLLCLMHNTEFKLFDGKKGKSFLSISKDQESPKYLLGLVVNTENFIFQVISTSISIKNYIDVSDDDLERYNMNSIPWCFTERDPDGELRLHSNPVS